MIEPKIRHQIQINQSAEQDFHKIYEDASEEDLFVSVSRLCGFCDEHKLAV